MTLEVAILNVIPGQEDAFERTFSEAKAIISGIDGYQSHELQKCLEQPNRYLLLVHWRTLENHTVGFRKSVEYQTWRQLLHHFYDPFPTVEHYETISS